MKFRRPRRRPFRQQIRARDDFEHLKLRTLRQVRATDRAAPDNSDLCRFHNKSFLLILNKSCNPV
jgi:hypothetical protein